MSEHIIDYNEMVEYYIEKAHMRYLPSDESIARMIEVHLRLARHDSPSVSWRLEGAEPHRSSDKQPCNLSMREALSEGVKKALRSKLRSVQSSDLVKSAEVFERLAFLRQPPNTGFGLYRVPRAIGNSSYWLDKQWEATGNSLEDAKKLLPSDKSTDHMGAAGDSMTPITEGDGRAHSASYWLLMTSHKPTSIVWMVRTQRGTPL